MIHILNPAEPLKALCGHSILDGPGHHFVDSPTYADCPKCLAVVDSREHRPPEEDVSA